MPIFTAIGTAVAGALFAGSALAASIISGGLAIAAKLGISYLTRPKKRSYSAVQGTVQLGSDVGVSTVFGKSKVAGHRVYYAKYGAGNKFNAEVFRLAHGWCDGLEPEIYFYGEKHTLLPESVSGNEAERYTVDGFDDLISIRFYDGQPGQLADSELVTATSGQNNPWKSTSVGTGICYAVVERRFDADKFSKGRPEFEFVLRGLREYDPREDDTVNGGSGAQRLADPSTWVWTENPAIHRLNYSLGLRGALSNRVLVGVGLQPGQIDMASHMTAADVCDTTRSVGARTIPTYACSLWVSADDDHIQILQEFEDAMAGYHVNRSGLSGVIAGAPQSAVLTLTADDIRTDEGQSSKSRKSSFDTVNSLSGQFTSPASHWNPESLSTVTINADVTADGRPRQASNDFLQVTDPDIAQYLLNIRYRQNRKQGSASLPVSRRVGAQLEPGDWISWNSKTWLVTKVAFDERVKFRIDLSETGSDIYAEEGIDPGPVVTPPSVPNNPSLASTVANFNVTAGLLENTDNGTQFPVLRFTWDDPEDPTITQVRIEYRVQGETDILEAISSDPSSGELTVSAGILGEVIYEARATIRTLPDRLKTFTTWKTTSTATGALSIAIRLSSLGQDVTAFLQLLSQQYQDVSELIDQLASNTAIGMGRSVERLSAIVRANNALAASILELSASITELDGEVQANADLIAAVEASVGENLAGGLFSISGSATTDEAEALISMLARVSTSETFEQAGLAIQVRQITGGAYEGRIILTADQIVLTDGSSEKQPFTFEGGEFIGDFARFREAVAEGFTTPSGNARFGILAPGVEGLEITT